MNNPTGEKSLIHIVTETFKGGQEHRFEYSVLTRNSVHNASLMKTETSKLVYFTFLHSVMSYGEVQQAAKMCYASNRKSLE